jgi:hypothetical protein
MLDGCPCQVADPARVEYVAAVTLRVSPPLRVSRLDNRQQCLLSARAPRLKLATGLFCTPRRSGACAGGFRAMSSSMRSELRELVWLASLVSGLSFIGVGLAVAVALVRLA